MPGGWNSVVLYVSELDEMEWQQIACSCVFDESPAALATSD